MLPTFIGIGPGRTGTSMLYEALRSHPEVCMARGTKETNYFAHHHRQGPGWYAQFFKTCGAEKARGEISNLYFYDPEVPARIHAALPDVRLFTCLRNPFERLRSVYHYRLRSGEIPTTTSLDEAVRRYPDLTTDSCYATKLAGYYTHFERAQIQVLFYDDLVEDPVAFVQGLFRFLGISTASIPAVVHERVNASAAARVPGIGEAARLLRHTGLRRILDWAKRSRWVRQALLKPTGAPVTNPALHISEESFCGLLEAWGPEVEQVAQQEGRSLHHWLERPDWAHSDRL